MFSCRLAACRDADGPSGVTSPPQESPLAADSDSAVFEGALATVRVLAAEVDALKSVLPL